ncbi:MAG: hypothetical protein QOJ84_1128 [Bradyrhizobium sp.]|nr:hypothetical protein [Bradyrhizobium sp.]
MANAVQRSRNERLIRDGNVLQVDTPDRIGKFLARRGMVRSGAGLELTGALPADAGEFPGFGIETVEVLKRIMGTSDLMAISFLQRGLDVARSVGRLWVNIKIGHSSA